MSRSIEEFQQAAHDRVITRWAIHRCSICNYPCAYEFYANGSVGYDSACDCVRAPLFDQSRSWADVADHYNMQTHPNVIAEYDAFWGFPSSTL